MKKKNVVAFLLAMVLAFGSFAETGITAMAGESDVSVETMVDAIRSEEGEDIEEESEESETTDAETVATPVDAIEAADEVADEEPEESSEEVAEAADESENEAEDAELEEPELEDIELEEVTLEDNEAEGIVVKVNYSTNAVKVTARIGAAAKKATSDANGVASFNIGEEDKLVVIVEALENSTITNATYVIGNTTKTLKASSKTYAEFAIAPAKENSDLTINTVENNVIKLDGNPVAKNGCSVKFSKPYTLHVQKGSDATEKITELKATRVVGKTTEDVTNKVVRDISSNGDASLNVSENLAGSTINLTINNKDTVKLIVEKKVVSASLAGVKGNTITLTAGVKKSFKINVNAGADVNEITALVDGTNKTTVALENGIVTITPANINDEGTLKLNYKGETLATYNVVTDLKAFERAKPVTKVISTDDIGANVKVSLPKGIKYADLKADAYYVIHYVDVRAIEDESLLNGEDADNYVGRFMVEITGDSQEVRLDFIKNRPGEGYAAKFYLTTFLCLKEHASGDVIYVEEADAVTELSTKDAITVSTKKPAYATSLSLINQKKTISYAEAKDMVVIATASFDKNATFRKIQWVECDNSNVYVTISEDGTKLLAKVYRYTSKSYTVNITAVAMQPNYTMPATATMKLTVSGANPYWKFENITPKLYKQEGAAITLKTKLYNNNKNYSTVKYKSVSYKLYNDKDTEVNSKYIGVNKAGVVTVAKNYVVGAYDSDTYYVKATVTNPNGLTSEVKTGTFTVVEAKKVVIGKVLIDDYSEGELKEIKSSECFMALKVYDEDETLIPKVDYSVSVKNLIYSRGCIYFVKPGNASFTVSMNYGGSKRTVNFKVVPSSEPLTIQQTTIWNFSNTLSTGSENNIDYTNGALQVIYANKNPGYYDVLDDISVTAKYGVVTSISGKALKGIESYWSGGFYSKAEVQCIMQGYRNMFAYTPKTAEDVITITNKSLSANDPNREVTYTIHNTGFSSETNKSSILAGNTLNGYCVSPDRYDISGKLENLEEGYNYNVKIASVSSEMMADYEKYKGFNFKELSFDVTKDSPEFLKSLRTGINASEEPMLGTYNINMVVTRTKAGQEPVVVKNQMVKLVIKTSLASKINVPATIKLKGTDKGVRTKLPVTVTNGIMFDIPDSTEVNLFINANVNGQGNNFANYFKLVSETDKKGNIVYYIENLVSVKNIPVSDLVGCYLYGYGDYYDRAYYGYRKITLKK